MKRLFRTARRFLRDKRGASVVEFAFVAPVLMIISVLLIDVGRAMWASTTLEHVAREGARYASVRGDGSIDEIDPNISSEVNAFKDQVKSFATGFPAQDLTVTVTWNPNHTSGNPVTVQVDYQYDPLLIGFVPMDPIIIQGKASMIIM